MIWPLVEMLPWMYGAVSTLSSSTVAIRRRMFSLVSFSMRRPPSAVIVKSTTGRPAERPPDLSMPARASAM